MEGKRHADIIPIGRTSEYINGTALRLGEMPLQKLLELEAECRAQLENARCDLMIVRDYLDRRFPDDDGGSSA